MRAWLTKSDNTAPAPTGVLTAGEDNARAVEANNVVLSAGITLNGISGPDTNLKMMAEAVARYASGGIYYSDSGVANAHVLLSPSGENGFAMPRAYFNGMRIAFMPGHANTAATTVNVNGIGGKKLLSHAGAPLASGDLSAGRLVEAVYDSASDSGAGAFRLTPWSIAASGGGGGGGTSTPQVNADWNATSGVAMILNKPTFTGGGGVPQVNADWNAVSGVAAIFNRPTIMNADWNATGGPAYILNKPNIPGLVSPHRVINSGLIAHIERSSSANGSLSNTVVLNASQNVTIDATAYAVGKTELLNGYAQICVNMNAWIDDLSAGGRNFALFGTVVNGSRYTRVVYCEMDAIQQSTTGSDASVTDTNTHIFYVKLTNGVGTFYWGLGSQSGDPSLPATCTGWRIEADCYIDALFADL